MIVQIEVETMPTADAPLMIHEQVGSGSYRGHDFAMRRDLTGLHWQIKVGETTAAFSLEDILKDILKSVATSIIEKKSN